MNFSRRFKVGCLMTLLVSFCIGIGFIFGILAHQAWKKKTEQPEFMKWAAMKQLEKLKLTDEQRPQLEAKVDTAITELMTIKSKSLQSLWDTLDHTAADIDQSLTSEQKVKWSKLRPKRPKESK